MTSSGNEEMVPWASGKSVPLIAWSTSPLWGVENKENMRFWWQYFFLRPYPNGILGHVEVERANEKGWLQLEEEMEAKGKAEGNQGAGEVEVQEESR